MNDEKVISAIRARSETAIHEVITKYSRLLWKVAGAVLDHVGAAQDVEECVADAFIHLWEHPEKYDPKRGKLKTWLAIVVRTRALDRYRELTRHRDVPLEDAALLQSLGAAEDLLAQEEKKLLASAVASLDDPGREILIRRYYHGQKPREIALALGLSVKQVDNHLYRTKQKLRETLSR